MWTCPLQLEKDMDISGAASFLIALIKIFQFVLLPKNRTSDSKASQTKPQFCDTSKE